MNHHLSTIKHHYIIHDLCNQYHHLTTPGKKAFMPRSDRQKKELIAAGSKIYNAGSTASTRCRNRLLECACTWTPSYRRRCGFTPTAVDMNRTWHPHTLADSTTRPCFQERQILQRRQILQLKKKAEATAARPELLRSFRAWTKFNLAQFLEIPVYSEFKKVAKPCQKGCDDWEEVITERFQAGRRPPIPQ